MDNNFINFIQQNSPDGALKHTLQGEVFLQSEEWRKFQEAVGRKTYRITGEGFDVSIIEHSLPLVGSYLYTPRWPVMQISNLKFKISNQIQNPNEQILKQIQELITLAKKNNAGWIRIEPANEENLEIIKNIVGADLVSARKGQTQGLSLRKYKIIKAPHDMQPREILVMDITKSEEEISAKMKSKTRYNIKLAGKKGVIINVIDSGSGAGMTKYIDEFIKLTKIMGKRQKIAVHPDNYYRKMLETIPRDSLKLYVAEYQNKIIAANLVVFYGNTCTYLHGASDDSYKNVMAPQLLQWKQIQDAKAAGCGKYDLGGIKNQPHPSPLLSKERERQASFSFIRRRIKDEVNSWEGITRFKTGFSPNARPIEFPGSYDIIIAPGRYRLYRIIQKIKSII
jgi:lipid II:glycine glycyltransferase (peptidoglycan interpeptide bridge formation enzyme)